jgi:hypothetical protein
MIDKKRENLHYNSAVFGRLLSGGSAAVVFIGFYSESLCVIRCALMWDSIFIDFD